MSGTILNLILKNMKLDVPITATIITYSLYLVLLFCVLKGINKVFEGSEQEEKTDFDIKILKHLKGFILLSCIGVSIFKILLIYNTSDAEIFAKMIFLFLIFLIAYIVIYCLYVSDISKIKNFSSLFFVNEVNKKNIFYKGACIVAIFIILLIITYFIAVVLGTKFTESISKL